MAPSQAFIHAEFGLLISRGDHARQVTQRILAIEKAGPFVP